MPRPLCLLLALLICLPLASCAIVTSMEVTGPVRGYYFVSAKKVERLSEAERRRYILQRRRAMNRQDPAPLTVGRRYLFVPICGNGPAWNRVEPSVGRAGGSVPLTC